jgi:ribosomal protein S24E
MEMKVNSDNENKLFGRREIVATTQFEGKTPTKAEIKESICKQMNLDPEISEVIRIDQAYGLKKCTATVYTYTNKEMMQKSVRNVKAKKPKGKKGAAAPAKK